MPMQPGPRMTLATQRVLHALLEQPAAEQYGLQISTATGLPSGTIHPILARLDTLQWLESRWEDEDPHDQGRPKRRYYRLTPNGAERARQALAACRTRVSRSAASEVIAGSLTKPER